MLDTHHIKYASNIENYQISFIPIYDHDDLTMSRFDN